MCLFLSSTETHLQFYRVCLCLCLCLSLCLLPFHPRTITGQELPLSGGNIATGGLASGSLAARVAGDVGMGGRGLDPGGYDFYPDNGDYQVRNTLIHFYTLPQTYTLLALIFGFYFLPLFSAEKVVVFVAVVLFVYACGRACVCVHVHVCACVCICV